MTNALSQDANKLKKLMERSSKEKALAFANSCPVTVLDELASQYNFEIENQTIIGFEYAPYEPFSEETEVVRKRISR